jgi:oligosaccharide translocation protein RFT1
MAEESKAPTTSANSDGDVLGSTVLRAVSQLVGLQLFSRAFTFILNQTLVRIASPEVFGTVTVQFDLLLSTILFLSREGVRTSLLRTSSTSSHTKEHSDRVQLIANNSLIPIALGLPLSVLATLAYYKLASNDTKSQSYFTLSISLYAFAALLELLSEPFYLRAISELKLNVRVRAEGAAAVAKTMTCVMLLVVSNSEWSLVAFASGQVAYGATVLLVFAKEYGKDWDIRPKGIVQSIHGK